MVSFVLIIRINFELSLFLIISLAGLAISYSARKQIELELQ